MVTAPMETVVHVKQTLITWLIRKRIRFISAWTTVELVVGRVSGDISADFSQNCCQLIVMLNHSTELFRGTDGGVGASTTSDKYKIEVASIQTIRSPHHFASPYFRFETTVL